MSSARTSSCPSSKSAIGSTFSVRVFLDPIGGASMFSASDRSGMSRHGRVHRRQRHLLQRLPTAERRLRHVDATAREEEEEQGEEGSCRYERRCRRKCGETGARRKVVVNASAK